ncbi:alkane 1-monooxygenase [Loktanella sp. Alg231-35]|uniref:alkane 1-monooxygenase n=1 Tax=Loktanella sp. Alg231-35 TaxID=1922220 RepID=UPI000D5596F9|nr:alkane 1-monooxygenase [Loktanella sp. Alg231-35]
MTTIPATPKIAQLTTALPFWLSLALVPLAIFAAVQGGWAIALLPLSTWYLFTGLDYVVGKNTENPDLDTPEEKLQWYRLNTLLWTPVQLITIFGIMVYVVRTDHLHWFEEWALFAALGVLSGTVGIVYAHELMHQKPKSERWMADILLASVLYSHFRSEHLLVHHRYIGTPRDPVTARYGESFYRFFPRVLYQSLVSSFKAEKGMLARKKLPWMHLSNPFWLYLGLQAGFVLLAWLIGGGWGVFLFTVQAFWAVFQLELVDYVEHYGLTRKHLGDGKYEHVLPRHSWNATQQASNWLLINLQRHSDHHYKPNRRFPLLQTYDEDEAPQLPYGYPLMTMTALVPTAWRKMMNPRVKDWRARYYPEIEDWEPYKTASNPMPR